MISSLGPAYWNPAWFLTGFYNQKFKRCQLQLDCMPTDFLWKRLDGRLLKLESMIGQTWLFGNFQLRVSWYWFGTPWPMHTSCEPRLICKLINNATFDLYNDHSEDFIKLVNLNILLSYCFNLWVYSKIVWSGLQRWTCRNVDWQTTVQKLCRKSWNTTQRWLLLTFDRIPWLVWTSEIHGLFIYLFKALGYIHVDTSMSLGFGFGLWVNVLWINVTVFHYTTGTLLTRKQSEPAGTSARQCYSPGGVTIFALPAVPLCPP